MVGRRAEHDELIEIGLPVSADLDARLGDAIARGRKLAEAARGVRGQREYERWKDDVTEWRTASAETLEAGFATSVARDALLDVWVCNTPVCTIWPDWLKTEREALNAALDFAERIRQAAASSTA